jgi:hypothetical protein
MDNAAGVSRGGEIMPIDPTFSQICNQIRSLPPTRGLRLVKGDLSVRESTRPEPHQLGRLADQGKAVRQIEKSIDAELGTGEGKKLLKEMGGVYHRFGARITPEQVIAIEARIKQKKVLSGEPVHFFLPPTDVQAVSDTLRRDIADARDAQKIDPQFTIDDARDEIVIETDGGTRRNLTHEAYEKFKNKVDRLDYVLKELKNHVMDARDDDAVNERRLYLLTTILNQRTILTSYCPALGLLGGKTAGMKDATELNRNCTAYVINKVRDDEGRHHLKLDCINITEDVALFVKDDGGDTVNLVTGSSNLSMNTHIEVSSEDLGKGNAEGIMVGPVEVSVQLTPVRRS